MKKPKKHRFVVLAAVLVLAVLIAVVAAVSLKGGPGASTADKPELEVVGVDDEDDSDRALFSASARTEDVGDPTIVPAGFSLPAAGKEWTVMVYLVGSNLESRFGNATADLREMTSAGVDFSRSNVIVYAGGSRRWQSDLPSDVNSVLDLSLPEGERVVAQTEGKADMGAPDTLAAFVNYACEQYPAEHYALILWDHGGGPLWGYGADENYKNDTLLLAEMRQAMNQTRFANGEKLDFVGFDACLMGSVEVASVWSDYARYLVASEELEPGDGWDYAFLATLNDSPDALGLTSAIVDSYGAYYEAAASELFDPDVTLATYDLSKVGQVTAALGSLSDELDAQLAGGGYAAVSQARGDAHALGLSAVASRGEGYDLVDLGSLCGQLADALPWEAKDLSGAIDELVVSQTSNVEGLGGLSVYFPGDNAELYQASGEDVLGDVAASGSYRSFCNAYAGDWLGDSPADWTLGEVTSEGDHYELQLTDEQLENLSGAYYTVLAAVGDEGEYQPTLENVRLYPDADGVVSIPVDPNVICVTTDDVQSPSAWLFAQTESIGGAATYRSLGTYLGTGAVLGESHIGSESSIQVNVSLEARDGEREAAVRSVEAASDALSLSGKQTIDVSDYEYVGVYHGRSVSPTRDERGQLLPWTSWVDHSTIWWDYVGVEESLEFVFVPVSELATQGDDAYVCQLTLTDVNGGVHASDLLELAGGSRDETTVATPEGSLAFALYDDHAEVVGYAGADVDLEVPSEVEGLPVTVVSELLDADDETVEHVTLPDSVTTIAECSFGSDGSGANRSLTSIDFGTGLRTIGYAAFCTCSSLVSADLPEGVTDIGGSAFMGTSLTSVRVPSTLRSLGKGAFADITTLPAFEQDGENGVTSVRDGVLFSADGTTLLAYPGARGDAYDIPAGTTSIGYAAFAYAKLTSASFPEGLVSIGNCAFLGCARLTAISLPDSLESIGAWAFYTPFWATYTIGDDGFFTQSYTEFEEVHFGESLSRIGGGAFEDTRVMSFDVSEDNMTYSSPGGFLCNKAGDNIVAVPEGKRGVIEVPDGVTTLASGTFAYLDDSYYGGVTDVVLPDSVYRFSSSVFPEASEDTGTYAVLLHASEGSAAEAYAQRYGLPHDNVCDPEALTYTQDTVELEGALLTFRVYGDHATLVAVDETVDTGLHDGQEALRLEVPEEVDDRPVTQLGLGNDYLLRPAGYDTIVIPANVTTVTGLALMSWGHLELAPGNASYELVDDALFTADGATLVRYVGSEASYQVPEGTQDIGAYAFRDLGDDTLESVTLPSSVTAIGSHAFYGCASLTDVAFAEGLEEIGDAAFGLCPIGELRLPQTLRSVGTYAFYGNDGGFARIDLPDGLESIGQDAFSGRYATDGLVPAGSDTLEIGFALAPEKKDGLWHPFVGLDVSGFSVSEDNESLSAEGPLLLSADGTVLYECASGYEGTVVVPEGVESILYGAFVNCPHVTDVVLPEGVAYVSSGAFEEGITLHVPQGSVAERTAAELGIPHDNET